MADSNLPQVIMESNDSNLCYIEREGQILFAAEEVGKHLGYGDPVRAMSHLYRRNELELLPFSTVVKVTTVDGKTREVRHFTEEGVYLVSMLANTPVARNFRAMLARFLRKIRENRIEYAYNSGYDKGRQEALSLPVMEAERKAGYLDGLKEGKRLAARHDQLAALLKIRSYLARGLSNSEIAKLLDLSPSCVKMRISRARKNGLLPPSNHRAAQGSLFGVAK